MQKQAHVFYSGRVQGVGFRFTAVSLAEQTGVKGFVRNLDDGRVEVLAQADQEALEDFLSRLKSEFSAYITGVQAEQSEAQAAPKDFQIKF